MDCNAGGIAFCVLVFAILHTVMQIKYFHCSHNKILLDFGHERVAGGKLLVKLF